MRRRARRCPARSTFPLRALLPVQLLESELRAGADSEIRDTTWYTTMPSLSSCRAVGGLSTPREKMSAESNRLHPLPILPRQAQSDRAAHIADPPTAEN